MNPLSLLATGGKKIGGLFQAMGQNFDRNAAGPLPEILGSDYTPAMRSRARVNAIMGIGQALAGQAPLPQTLAHGQQSILAGWQMGQELKRQKEARAAMADLGQSMMQNQTGGSDAESLFNKANWFENLAGKFLMTGNEKGAEHYMTAAAKLRETAQRLTKQPVGQPVEGVGPDGKPIFYQQYNNATGSALPVAPLPKTQLTDLGDRVGVMNMSVPGQFMTKGQTPDNKANLTQNETQFSRRFPLMERQTAATEMGARASMASAGAAQQNAGTAAARLEFDKLNPPSGKLGEAAVDNIAQVQQGIRQLSSLADAIEKNKSWMGPVTGTAMSLPGADKAAQMAGYDAHAILESQIALAKQVIGKALEGGVLRKEDEAKYAKILPTMQDTPEVAGQKIRMIQSQLLQDLAVYLNTQKENGRRVGTSAPAAPGSPRISITPIP